MNDRKTVYYVHRKSFWLIPNLLSLDAPLVAVAWLHIFAKTWRVNYLPWVACLSQALVVWVIHVTDRLVDASTQRDASPNGLVRDAPATSLIPPPKNRRPGGLTLCEGSICTTRSDSGSFRITRA
jgi:hypothetical protein